jgi:hypothetical protein
MDSPSPSTQERRLFSRLALGMTGMHESTGIYASVPPNAGVQLRGGQFGDLDAAGALGRRVICFVTLILAMRKPFDLLAEGLLSERVGATRRLLNFLSPASAAWDHGGGVNSKTASRPEFGTRDGTSSGNLVPKNYCPSPVGISKSW